MLKFNLFLYFLCLDLKKYSVDIIVSKTKTATKSFKSPTFAFVVKHMVYIRSSILYAWVDKT